MELISRVNHYHPDFVSLVTTIIVQVFNYLLYCYNIARDGDNGSDRVILLVFPWSTRVFLRIRPSLFFVLFQRRRRGRHWTRRWWLLLPHLSWRSQSFLRHSPYIKVRTYSIQILPTQKFYSIVDFFFVPFLLLLYIFIDLLLKYWNFFDKIKYWNFGKYNFYFSLSI